MAKLGAEFSTYTVHIDSTEEITYGALKKILEEEKFMSMLQKNNIDHRIVGRDPSFDSLGLAASLCDMEDTEVQFGDFIVVFMRMPQTSVVEETQMELLDVASALVTAVGVRSKKEVVA